MSEVAVSEDQALIEAWIAECKSVSSRNSYRRNARAFLLMTAKPLSQTTADDVRTYAEKRVQGTVSSRATALSAVKSLLSFAFKSGLIAHNPGADVQITHERYNTVRHVIDQCDIERMIFMETDERNFALLMVAYSGGLMVSELAALKWGDVAEYESGAVLRVIGYEGKIRQVRISPASWKALSPLRGASRAVDPVFVSRKGGHMDPSAIHRVVKAAASRAGLPERMSTYWLRHAQTAYSIEAGTPLEALQDKLGHSKIDTTRRYARRLASAV